MRPALWKNASTLIVLARNHLGQTGGILKPHPPAQKQIPDFRCMLLKRSATSKFFAKAYVFPGGATESSDFSLDWLDHFAKYGHGHEKLVSEFVIPDTTRIPLYLECSNQPECIPEVGFRISAIRETFEETGVLICKTKENDGSKSNFVFDSVNEISRWQERVHEDPAQFLQLCRTYELFPDIWSLYEWSNWLTPTHLGSKRYDTIFYLCILNNVPEARIDGKEITEIQWIDPINAVSDHVHGHIWLAPPQMYELSRLANFSDGGELKAFAKKRQNFGLERWLPIGIKTKSELITVLPGDSLYPSGEGNIGNLEEKELDPENFGACRNRMYFANFNLTRICCNIEDPRGHKRLSKLFDELTKGTMESKL